MTDQFKEQYQKETEQIHAPADLIAKTKAAMCEEEARIQRERGAQTAGFTGREMKPVAQAPLFVEKKHNWNRAARRWVYPLTAVAAIFVLASISMMMRGLGKLDSDSAPYYESASADSGVAESATEETMEESALEEAPAMEESAAAATGTEDEAGAVTGGGAEPAEAEAVEEAALEEAPVMEESAAADMEGSADKRFDMEGPAGASDGEAASEKEMAESADEAKRAAEAPVADYAAKTNVTVKRIWEKPDFVDREDVQIQIYEDKFFWIVKEDGGWAAYVESESRGGYEIRGEAEDMESFLAAGYKRLLEISY